jgi:hypothetical protein
MGLQHLPEYNRFNYACAARIFAQTWGHMAPKKNVSYKGVVRFVLTDHSHYGCQPIIVTYDFPNLDGPYLHDELFQECLDWETDGLEIGKVYFRELTFRNYRFYRSQIKPDVSCT